MEVGHRAVDPAVADATKLMRLQSMLGAVLEEVRVVPADDPASAAAADLIRRAVVEVGSAVSERELTELGALIGQLGGELTVGESRVIDAQLVGWLGGLAMQHQWEGFQTMIASERRHLRRIQSEAASEARRRDRGLI